MTKVRCAQEKDVQQPETQRPTTGGCPCIYEMMIAQRLLSKARDEASRETWQTQVDVMQMFVLQAENDLEEQQEDLALCKAMIAEIEADLAAAASSNSGL